MENSTTEARKNKIWEMQNGVWTKLKSEIEIDSAFQTYSSIQNHLKSNSKWENINGIWSKKNVGNHNVNHSSVLNNKEKIAEPHKIEERLISTPNARQNTKWKQENGIWTKGKIGTNENPVDPIPKASAANATRQGGQAKKWSKKDGCWTKS